MTIVASNSLTLSNINDGTITHTAYAYSADGTDRFTTVYPNLNLLTDSKEFKNKNVEVYFATTSILSPGSTIIKEGNDTYLKYIKGTGVPDWFRAYMILGSSTSPNFPNVDVKPNSQYTFSVWLKGTGTHTIYAYDKWTIPNNTTLTVTLTDSWTKYVLTVNTATTIPTQNVHFFIRSATVGSEINLKYPKVEEGSTATSWMPSSSEVATADYPSYIGQYSDFTSTASTDPAKYAPWTVFKGNDGKDGATGPQGPTGPAGSNGDPGKIVSDTEPTTRFKGLTWKYSGTTDLTASDGTVIHPNTEYYYNGTHWMINYLSANNLEANSITADLIDAKNLTITDGEFVSTIIDGPVQTQTEIKDDHLLIYKMDTSHNEIHTIALKSDSGLAMTYQNSDTGEYTSAGVNFQGLFMQNNITNEFARLTPQGTKLSTDVPWTKLSLMNNFTGNIEYAIINGTVYISASGVGVPAMTAGQWKQAAQLPTGSSAIPIRANRITAGDSGDGLSWALLSNQAGGLFIRCSANKAATANLFNATLPYPIG